MMFSFAKTSPLNGFAAKATMRNETVQLLGTIIFAINSN